MSLVCKLSFSACSLRSGGTRSKLEVLGEHESELSERTNCEDVVSDARNGII